MGRTILALTLALGATVAPALAAPAARGAAPIPARPEQLQYGELRVRGAGRREYRHELPGGVVVYVVEDHALPLVKLSATFRTGAFREPDGKTGLASLTATMMRKGGTAFADPGGVRREGRLPRRRDRARPRPTCARRRRSTPSPRARRVCSTCFFDMLRNPRFDEARLAVEKGTALEEMKQRNDDAGDIVGPRVGLPDARREALRRPPADGRRPRRRSRATTSSRSTAAT